MINGILNASEVTNKISDGKFPEIFPGGKFPETFPDWKSSYYSCRYCTLLWWLVSFGKFMSSFSKRLTDLCAWSPTYNNAIRQIESFQRNFTKRLPAFTHRLSNMTADYSCVKYRQLGATASTSWPYLCRQDFVWTARCTRKRSTFLVSE